MRKIVCEVRDEYLLKSDTVIGAAGSHDDVALELHFSEMWDGTEKMVVWLDARGENPTSIILTEQMRPAGERSVYVAPVPAEAKAFEGCAKMSIRGAVASGGEELRATLSAAAGFAVLPSVYDEAAEEAAQPSPSVAQQLMSMIGELRGIKWAEYGVTRVSDMLGWVDAGYDVCIKHEGRIYRVADYVDQPMLFTREVTFCVLVGRRNYWINASYLGEGGTWTKGYDNFEGGEGT